MFVYTISDIICLIVIAVLSIYFVGFFIIDMLRKLFKK